MVVRTTIHSVFYNGKHCHSFYFQKQQALSFILYSEAASAAIHSVFLKRQALSFIIFSEAASTAIHLFF
jgi:hypothetical protein